MDLSALRTRLLDHVESGVLQLSDDVLGLPFVATALDSAGVAVQEVTLEPADGAIADGDPLTVHGRVDVLGLQGVALDLTVVAGEQGTDVAADLTVPAGVSLGIPGLDLDDVVLRFRQTGPDDLRRLTGAITGTTSHGPLELALAVEGTGPELRWTITATLDGELLQLLTGLLGDAAAEVVGPSLPVGETAALRDLILVMGYAPRARSVEALGLVLHGADWSVTGSVTVTEPTIMALLTSPGDPTRRSVGLTVDGAVEVSGVPLGVHLARDGGAWTLELAPGADAPGPSLTDLVGAFGGPDLPAVLPAELSGIGTLRLGGLGVVVDPATRAVSHLALLVSADWDVVPGRLRLDGGHAALDVDAPGNAADRRIGVTLGGTLVLGALRLVLEADHPKDTPGTTPWTFRGGLESGTVATLTDLLSAVAGADAPALPPEVPDLAVESCTFSTTPQTGELTVDAVVSAAFELPFGVPGLAAARTELHVARAAGTVDAPGPVDVRLRLTGTGPVPVVDGLTIDAFDLSFEITGAGSQRSWTLRGGVQAHVLDHPHTLTARLTESLTQRELVLEEEAAADSAPLVDVGGVGSLTWSRLSVTITRTGLGAAGGQVRLGAASAYDWSLSAAGHVDLLAGTLLIDGSLSLRRTATGVVLSLAPAGTGRLMQLQVPLPGTDTVAAHLALDHLDVARWTPADAPATWSVAATAAVWFTGLPGDLGRVLPSSSGSDLTGVFEAGTFDDGARVSLAVDPALPRQPVALGPLHVADQTITISRDPAQVEIGRVAVTWARGRGADVAAEFAVGLPADLNGVFGTHADGTPLTRPLITYDPANPNSLVRLRLSATTGGPGGPGLELELVSSPFTRLVLTPVKGTDQLAGHVDLGQYGALDLVVPRVGYRGGTFRASGGFRQRDLALPLSPLTWILRAMGLGGLAKLLPDALSIEPVNILDAVTGHLDAKALLARIADAAGATGATLPDSTVLQSALNALADRVDRLPDRLKPYLSFGVPESFSFDLAFTTQGGMSGGVSAGPPGVAAPRQVPGAQPIRLLLPGLALTGPVLNGIELWGLSVGELLGGAVMLVRADVTIDQFDLLALAAILALPDDALAALPETRPITRRVIADRLVMLVLPEALVAVPLFFEDLGVEYRGIEGLELAAHLRLPEPQLDLGEGMALMAQLKDFFTQPDAMLDEQGLAGVVSSLPDGTRSRMDVVLTAGPLFLGLPGYLGGKDLGSRTDTRSVSLLGNLAHLLNGLKGFRVDELLQALPDDVRSAPPAAPVRLALGPLTLDGRWSVGTPPGTSRGVAVHLAGETGAVGVVNLAATLDVSATDAHHVDVAFTVDGSVAHVFALHLDGSLHVADGPAATTAPAAPALLTFSGHDDRLTLPLASWTPTTFTVEWWVFPRALADFNQTVSAGDVWGSFVFHTTAGGAVYTGTDVATRFTPDQLPPGTVVLNRWQHFAFTFDHGHAVVYRDGTLLGSRVSMTAPQPWTGLHLGTSWPTSEIVGMCADVRVWDHARRADEIVADRLHRLAGSEPGLVAYWPLDEGSGDTLHDRGPAGAVAAVAPPRWAVPQPEQRLPLVAAPTDPQGAPGALRLAGSSRVAVGDHTIVTGSVVVTPQSFHLRGTLDLLPDNPVVTVRGNVAGDITAQSFLLEGNASVTVGGFRMASAAARLSDQGVSFTGSWLGILDTSLSVTWAGPAPSFTAAAALHLAFDHTFGQVQRRTQVGMVTLANGFRLAAGVDATLTISLTAAGAFSAAGTAKVALGATTVSVPFTLAEVPADRAALEGAIRDAIVGGPVLSYFTAVYGDAEAWAVGLRNGFFRWTAGAWDDIATAFRWGYGVAPSTAAHLLDDVGYSGVELGQVVRHWATDAQGMLTVLQQGEVGAVSVAQAIYSTFYGIPSSPDLAQVANLFRLMKAQFAFDPGAVGRDAFGLGPTDIGHAMRDAGFSTMEIGQMLATTFQQPAESAAAVFRRLGIAPEDVVLTLNGVFQVRVPQTAQQVLRDAGYLPQQIANEFQRWIDSLIH